MVKHPGRREDPVDVQPFPARHRTRPGAILGVSFSHPCSVDGFSFGSFPKMHSPPLDRLELFFPSQDHPVSHPSLPWVPGSSEHLPLRSAFPGGRGASIPESWEGKSGHQNKKEAWKNERICSVGALEEHPNLASFVKYPSFSSCHSTPSKRN